MHFRLNGMMDRSVVEYHHGRTFIALQGDLLEELNEAGRAATTLFAPEATRQSPLHRNRPGALRWRERRIAVFPGWLTSSQSRPGCAFFEREPVALKGEAFAPKGDRQGFQRARHRLSMHGFDALRDLSERHGLRARNLHCRGQHGFGQRAGTTTFVAREQAANPLLTPSMVG